MQKEKIIPFGNKRSLVIEIPTKVSRKRYVYKLKKDKTKIFLYIKCIVELMRCLQIIFIIWQSLIKILLKDEIS
ncbi:MAG: hypothetical protein PHX18_05260 [Candidatus Gastranaerophilales bacterium]|nr:hypothetical protein [Candidatus Gastranaerophilales bacterium]